MPAHGNHGGAHAIRLEAAPPSAAPTDETGAAALLVTLLLLLCVVCVGVWIGFARLSAAVVKRQNALVLREQELARRQAAEKEAHVARGLRAERLGSALSLGLKGQSAV